MPPPGSPPESGVSMKGIYVDHAATTPIDPRVLQAASAVYSLPCGNPSSSHRPGMDAREAMEKARFHVAGLIHAAPEEIIFTSGGTEADNLALKGFALANRHRGKHIMVSAIEHHAILHSAKRLRALGFEVTVLPVDSAGRVDPLDVQKNLRKKTILISIMHANNEVGTVQEIEEIGRLTREAGVALHTDAVQTAGSIPIDVDRLGVDMLSLSAHKFYGPPGAGALYIRKGLKVLPILDGGAQEHGLRAGTENLPAIVGMGAAAQLAQAETAARTEHIRGLRDLFIKTILALDKGITLNGHPQARLAGNVNICLGSTGNKESLETLSASGIHASAGSACNSHALKPSHVLTAMGIPREKALTALRFTFGKDNSREEVEYIGRELGRLLRVRARRHQHPSAAGPAKPPPGTGKIIDLDVRGLYCPLPILKTSETFSSLRIGDVLRVVADDPAAEADLQNWTRSTGQEGVGLLRNGTKICFSIRKCKDF